MDCQPSNDGRGCIGYSDDTASDVNYPNVRYTVPSNFSSFLQTHIDSSVKYFINAIGGGGVGTTHSPWYARDNTGATVSFSKVDLGDDICGDFAPSSYINAPPDNHGCCQQLTLTGGNLRLNTRVSYNASGDNSFNHCDIRWTVNHELGHSLGLGHTKNSSQTMYLHAVQIYSAQTYDKRGVSCIYENQNC